MKIGIPGLGGRLQRARKETGLSQVAVGERIGVSWMTVHRWEKSQRMIPDETLARLCDLYNKPLRWFLTLEEGDLDQESGLSERVRRASSSAANRLSRTIAEAPAIHRPILERIVEHLLEDLRRVR